MAHFTSDFHTFFAGLEAHNDREWYAEHKKDYERHVRDPFKAFVTDVIAACAERDPEFGDVETKQCVFRIHRDTRFSKDKTPYKTHASANIAPGGKKSGDPGLYVHADAHHLRIGGGAYWVEKDDLYVLRERMAANPQDSMPCWTRPNSRTTMAPCSANATSDCRRNSRRPRNPVRTSSTNSSIIWLNCRLPTC